MVNEAFLRSCFHQSIKPGNEPDRTAQQSQKINCPRVNFPYKIQLEEEIITSFTIEILVWDAPVQESDSKVALKIFADLAPPAKLPDIFFECRRNGT